LYCTQDIPKYSLPTENYSKNNKKQTFLAKKANFVHFLLLFWQHILRENAAKK